MSEHMAYATHYTRTGADHGGQRDMTRHSGPGTAHTRAWVPPTKWAKMSRAERDAFLTRVGK